MSYHAQIDWRDIRRTPRVAVTADLIRFAAEHFHRTGKVIYPLTRKPT